MSGRSRRARLREHLQLLRDTARLLGPSARLLTTTEAHTYAYSVSANFLLASLPFLFLLLWIGHRLLPGLTTQHATMAQMLEAFLPAGQQRLVGDAIRLASRHTVQAFSLLMLAISSSGVFLPLEVALNSIWGFPRNRGYLGNQLVSLALVLACGAVAFAALVLASLGTAAAQALVPASWTGLIAGLTLFSLTLVSVPAAIVVFFIIYWKLPNGKVPASQVFPAALYAGLLAVVFTTGFRWLLPYLDFPSVYASLALPVTLIVWGYGGALLLLFGASLSARGVARLPATRIRLPRYAELRAWYAAHGRHPAHEATEAADEPR
ncbi:MAG: YihY/virulence factor BrkB family protein [Terriglobales bacterium]